ncbi:MAG: hypothetical protein ACRDP4_10790, partial [Nocardioidaceae bacterium]
PRLARHSAEAQRGWQRFAEAVHAWPGQTAIISHEHFGAASQEQAARAIADLAPAEVHLVFTARDFARQLPAVWQENLKWGLTTPLSEWEPLDPGGPQNLWSWRTIDPVGILKRWQGDLPPSQVHVVTMPKSRATPSSLWDRFAAVCDIPPEVCDLDSAQANPTMGAAESELMRRVVSRAGEPVKDTKETGRWVRHYLTQDVLAPRNGRKLSLSDARVEPLMERAKATVAFVQERGYDVAGDLDDLLPTPPATSADQPDLVSDSELLEAATDSMARMLATVRERTLERDELREKLRQSRRRVRAAPGEPRPVKEAHPRQLLPRVRRRVAQVPGARRLRDLLLRR